MDLTYAYRTIFPTSTQYTSFSAAHGTFSNIHQILGLNANLKIGKKIEIIPCMYLITMP
jgi:hypothetical protein